MKTYVHLRWYRAEFVLEWDMSDKFVQKIKTHFMVNNFVPENRAVCEKMWKDVEPDWSEMTVQV
jgi:hypothetical protein